MNLTETVRLLRIVVALAPSQKVDEFTPDAWQIVLSDLSYDECAAAIGRVARRQPYVAPSDIVGEVLCSRRDRAARLPLGAVPDADPDDPRAYTAALRHGRYRLPGPDAIERGRDAVAALVATFPHTLRDRSKSAPPAVPLEGS